MIHTQENGMNKKIILHLIFLVFSVLLIIACHQKDQLQDQKPIVISEIKERASIEFSKMTSVEFSDISYPLMTLVKDHIWIYGINSDGTANFERINIYDVDFNCIDSKRLHLGEGPGDSGGATILFSNDKKIFAADHILRRVTILDTDLVYEKIIKTETNFINITFDRGMNFLIFEKKRSDRRTRNYLVSDFYITSFPRMTKKIFYSSDRYTSFEDSKYVMGQAPIFHYFFKENEVFFIDMMNYAIYKFDINGQILKHVRVSVNLVETPPEKEFEWLQEHTRRLTNKKSFKLAKVIQPAAWMIPLKKGFIVIRRKSWGLGCEDCAEGDYFDYDLNLLGKTKVPCFRRIYNLKDVFFPYTIVYRDGFLYCIKESEDHYFLEKWNVDE